MSVGWLRVGCRYNVPGTLWHISDKHSVEVALNASVYREMLEGSDKIDPKRVGIGLHSAIQKLRDELGEQGTGVGSIYSCGNLIN
jgi:hypothetical protein